MKNRLGVVVAFLLFNALPAQAQNWTGATNNNWSVGSNWTGGIAPANGPATAVTFAGSALSFTPNVDLAWTINSMTITSPGYSFSGTTLGFGGTNPAITVSQPGVTFGNPLAFFANVTLDNSHPLTLSGGLSGAANLTKTGAGTLVVSGATWHTGSTIVTAGTLQIGDGIVTPSFVRAIVNAGALVFDSPGPGNVDIQGAITGSGTLTLTAGTVVRNASIFPIAHQGITTVDGSLDVFTGGIDSNGPLHIGPSGTFGASSDATVGSITGSGTSQLNVFNSTLTTGSDDSSTTYSGNIVGGTSNLRKVGAGTFTLATNSNFPGNLIVDAGTLRLGNGTIGPGITQGITVNGTIEFDVNHPISIPGPVTGTGDVWIKSGTTVSHSGFAPFTHQGTTTIEGRLSGGSPATINNNGPVLIAALGIFDVNGAGTVGSVAGAGTLSVNGGALTLGGDNSSTTFSGFFVGNGEVRKVGSGTFTVTSSGFPTGEVTVEAPGTLQLGNGAFGPNVLAAVTINGTLLIDTPIMNLSGAVTGTGSLRVQSGSTVVNGSGVPLAHQGATVVNGTLDVSAPITSIDNNGPLVIGPSGSFSTRTGQVGSLSGFGSLNVQFGTFIVGGDNSSTTFSGSIAGNGEFRKTGSGTLTLATPSFFGGDVIIEAPGSLRLGDGSTGPTNVNVGSILVDGGLLFNTPAVNVTSIISGNGSITVQSGSVVNLNALFPMTHSGTTIVSGQLNSPAIAAISNNSPLLLSGQVVTRGGSVGSVAGSGTLQLTGGTFTTGGNNLPTAFAGALSNSGSLVKTGTSTFTLSGASPAYTGQIQVATGTLQVAGSLTTSGINVVTGATLNGNGTITGPVNVEIGGNLAPGTSVGTLTTGNLSIAGNLQIEIQGTAPGTQHDRLNVNGTVAINGAALVLSGGYLPVTGNSFTIIQNDGADAVIGTFAGLPEGATLTFNGVSLRISYIGGTGNDVVLSLAAYTVTPSASANGSISPSSPQVVSPGNTITFTVSPSVGYATSVGGTCGGNLSGTTYTTNPVNSDCTVVANFTLTTLTVTPSAGPNGSIAPSTPQPVAPGGTLAFMVTANTGYAPLVGGTCGGNLVGTTYTTNPVNSNCTVLASFSLNTYTVTPTAGPNGTITPSTPQTVAHGAQISFMVTADAQFTAVVAGTCGGSLAGNIYTSNPITASCTVVVTFEQQNPHRMVNISTRMQVLTGNDVLIGGFVIGGSTNKTVAVVAYGPSLSSFGIANALANPTLTLVRSSDQAVVGTNNDWQTASNASQLQAAGFAPSNALESAIYANLAPGAYTAVVQGVANGTGVGMIAVYEGDTINTPLINISTRGRVLTGNDVMIGGFIIQGQGPQTVAIVGTGPSLSAFGIASPLANPTLSLVRLSDQTTIETNDDWQTGPNAAQLQAAGFAPSNPLESAIYVTLQPGAYTAILSGVGNGTGVGVIGVYKVN